MSDSHPLSGAESAWEAVIDDAESTAAEYRESGWTVTELHPGDVTPLPAGQTDEDEYVDDRTGLDVLLPGDEFRAVEELVDDAEFDEYDAYTAREGPISFVVLVMKASDVSQAVVFPLYYRADRAQETLRRAREHGEMRTYLRPLSDERRVVFTQSDPDPFFVEGED